MQPAVTPAVTNVLCLALLQGVIGRQQLLCGDGELFKDGWLWLAKAVLLEQLDIIELAVGVEDLEGRGPRGAVEEKGQHQRGRRRFEKYASASQAHLFTGSNVTKRQHLESEQSRTGRERHTASVPAHAGFAHQPRAHLQRRLGVKEAGVVLSRHVVQNVSHRHHADAAVFVIREAAKVV